MPGWVNSARSHVPSERFYSTLLEECVRALSAVGGAVWLRSAGGAMRPVAQIRWPGTDFAADDAARRAHEALLTAAVTRGEIMIIGPRAARSDATGHDSAIHGPTSQEAGNPTDHVLLMGPVQLTIDVACSHEPRPLAAESSTLAIIEILQRADASPAAYRGYEQFLAAVCELAADFHAYSELGRLRGSEGYRQQLLRLSAEAHRVVELPATVNTVANDGRRVVGCDRLNVLVARGRQMRLLGTSGVGHIERRSGAARRLEQLAELVRRTGEAAYYTDGQSDAHLPIAEALEKHADESHARQVAAIPLARPADPADREGDRSTRAKRELPAIVLVAEQFDAEQGNLDRERLVEVGEVCTTALYNALDFDRLPLSGIWRWLGAVKHQVATHLTRTAMIAVALAAVVAALVLIDTDFTIEAPGTLQPVVQRDVFAPRGGLVDEVLVAHGDQVAAGQPLLRLRDPSLELDLKRVTGEMETVRRQLDAVRATKTSSDARDSAATDLYRLSADEREFAQRLENLEHELDLLSLERERLVVRSPIAGQVLTWDVADRLIARPVDRGEVLVTVADLSADWQLELEVPDDQIGHVMAARRKLEPDLSVRYHLRGEDNAKHVGHIEEISTTADVEGKSGSAPSPHVLVKVALNTAELSDAMPGELRPGLSARAKSNAAGARSATSGCTTCGTR